MNYRIVELHRQYSLECSKDGTKWLPVNTTNVPRFFETLEDARSWVATIKRGVVYHELEGKGLQWFLDRIGKKLVRDGLTVPVMDDDHARHLHRLSQEMGYVYEDASNLPVDERKAEDDTSNGVKPLEWFLERVGKDVRREGGMMKCQSAIVNIYSEDLAITCCTYHQAFGWRYSDVEPSRQ